MFLNGSERVGFKVKKGRARGVGFVLSECTWVLTIAIPRIVFFLEICLWSFCHRSLLYLCSFQFYPILLLSWTGFIERRWVFVGLRVNMRVFGTGNFG